MKCPKCHYLSFDPEPRCRNCGYDLALEDVDVPIKADESDGPLVDLELHAPGSADDARSEPRRSPFASSAVATPPAVPRPVGRSVFAAASAKNPAAFEASPTPFEVEIAPPAPAPPPPARAARAADSQLPDLTVFRTSPGSKAASVPPPARPAPAAPAEPAAPPPASIVSAPVVSSAPAPAPPPKIAPPTTELPLFVKGLSDERPIISVPGEPRQPLSVRRKAVEPAASAPRPAPQSSPRKLGPLDRDLLEDLQRLERAERRDAAAQTRSAAAIDDSDRVGAGKRLSAALIDGVLLGSLGTGIVGLTIRWCDLTWAQAQQLPMVPTAAFVALVFLGYLLMFTAAGGQTLGKMVLGIRVVGDDVDEGSTLRVGQAALRSLVTLPSVLALGAGFLPALMGDERALHDRLAHTRVVRA
jgi:uncharacterized RDD family membrane protein YckC